MKAIIKTFSTQDCEKIFNGENDSYCIHKPAPKIEPPFKVYVYQTKEGKVVGEFVYDEEKNITKVKLYDKPKDIKEFRKPCPYGDLPCTICPKCRKDKSGYIQCFNTVNHPPQSWCYVVEE